jgi:hypothetical protein
MGLSLAKMLEHSADIPETARTAIADGRLEEAGRILMAEFDLSCDEATELVDRILCPPSE